MLQREGSRRLGVRGVVGLDEVVPAAVRWKPVGSPLRRALECWSYGLGIVHYRSIHTSPKSDCSQQSNITYRIQSMVSPSIRSIFLR